MRERRLPSTGGPGGIGAAQITMYALIRKTFWTLSTSHVSYHERCLGGQICVRSVRVTCARSVLRRRVASHISSVDWGVVGTVDFGFTSAAGRVRLVVLGVIEVLAVHRRAP